VTVREWCSEDTPALLFMARRFVTETPYSQFGAAPGALECMLALVLEHGIVFLAEREGALIGFLAALVAPHPLTGIPFVDEVAWWVEPEYRHGAAGPRLLQTLEKWARTKGVPSIRMVAPAGSRVGRFYKRRGYVEIETSFLRIL